MIILNLKQTYENEIGNGCFVFYLQIMDRLRLFKGRIKNANKNRKLGNRRNSVCVMQASRRLQESHLANE